MTVGYCPNCKKMVKTSRVNFNVRLAVILLIFTLGIGFIAYLILWAFMPEERCEICRSITTLKPTDENPDPKLIR